MKRWNENPAILPLAFLPGGDFEDLRISMGQGSLSCHLPIGLPHDTHVGPQLEPKGPSFQKRI